MSTLYYDLRTALRTLRRRPAVALLTIVVLAFGIGVNAAAFSVVDAVLLRSLPVEDPDSLVSLVLTFVDRGGYFGVRAYDYKAWRDQSRSFVSLAATQDKTFVVLGDDRPERVRGTRVTPSYFETLGVAPTQGRAIIDDDLARGERVVVVSHAYWQSKLGADSDVLGRCLVLDQEPHTVIGVMPESAKLPYLDWHDLWTPLDLDEDPEGEPTWGWRLGVLGRLREGVSLDDARRDLDAVAARLAAEMPATHENVGAHMEPVSWWIFYGLEKPLFWLYGASALVLLVACGTVSNLASSRLVERRRDMAVHKALGAPGGRLLCQLLAESVLLALAGGTVGLVLAWAAAEAVPGFVPELPRISEMRLDLRLLATMFAVSLTAGAASGLAPALALSRTSTAALGGAREGVGSKSGRRLRHILVAAQTALAVTAVIGAGLLLRSLAELESVDPGFEPDNLLTLRLEIPDDRFTDKQARIATLSDLLGRVEALPGVASAGASGQGVPLRSDKGTFELYLEGRARGSRPDVVVTAQTVSDGYLEAMGIELVSGRGFEPGETWETAQAVLVNETMAKRYWPGEDAAGRWVEWQTGDRGTVVGVVRDVHQQALHLEVAAEVYIAWGSVSLTQTLALRTTTGAAEDLLTRIREETAALLPGVPVYAVRTGEQLLRESYADRRLWTSLTGLFALLALGLGLIGFYGVTAHSVAGRTREIGIRMALGAWPAAILRLVALQGLRPVVVGLAGGVALALVLTRFAESQLYGVSTRDPLTFVAGGILILASAAAVGALPARRAARVDPAVAVRGHE